MPSIAKKRLIRKKSREIIYVPTRNLFPQKLLVQRFWIEFEKFKNSKYESDLVKIFDCFFDCHGSVHFDYVSFVIK